MAENTKIEWADHTFNPWVGCTKVSAACDNCYAEGWAKRTGQAHLWAGDRRRTTEANWQQPLKWNRQAEREGRRFRVFCASLADVFDNQVPDEWRADLWRLIDTTQHLDWLLLTKRPENALKMIIKARRDVLGFDASEPNVRWPWPNVWLGTTVENQEEADRRIPHLLAMPAAVHFLSCEPLLGPVDLTRVWASMPSGGRSLWNVLAGDSYTPTGAFHGIAEKRTRIDWVIAGGESGKDARPMHPDWARSLRDQCAAAGVPFHFKQWGEYAPVGHVDRGHATDPAEFAWERIGKKAAGRLLDGVEHNGLPAHG